MCVRGGSKKERVHTCLCAHACLCVHAQFEANHRPEWKLCEAMMTPKSRAASSAHLYFRQDVGACSRVCMCTCTNHDTWVEAMRSDDDPLEQCCRSSTLLSADRSKVQTVVIPPKVLCKYTRSHISTGTALKGPRNHFVHEITNLNDTCTELVTLRAEEYFFPDAENL